MQKFRCVGAMAAMAAFVSGAALGLPASAQEGGYRTEARLATANPAPREAVIGGVSWRCEGGDCQGAADRKGNLDGLVRECKKVVAIVGPVASYRSGGRELSDGQVRACNKAAIRMQAARN